MTTPLYADVQVSVFWDVADTVRGDFQRSEAVFQSVPVKFNVKTFKISREQTRSMLGDNEALSIQGGPTQFDHKLPEGLFAGQSITVQDREGRFTTEVWQAIRDWTNFGGIRVFYVKQFENTNEARVVGNQIQVFRTGGITLAARDKLSQDIFDPIIFIDQSQNLSTLKKTNGRFGLLEHELGHAFGLAHTDRQGTLMFAVSDDRSGNALSASELATIRQSDMAHAF